MKKSKKSFYKRFDFNKSLVCVRRSLLPDSKTATMYFCSLYFLYAGSKDFFKATSFFSVLVSHISIVFSLSLIKNSKSAPLSLINIIGIFYYIYTIPPWIDKCVSRHHDYDLAILRSFYINRLQRNQRKKLTWLQLLSPKMNPLPNQNQPKPARLTM